MSPSRNAGALIRAMLALRNERRTGVLRVDAAGVRTFVYLLKGAPVFAEEGTTGETLGRLLVRQGVLTQERYVQVIERMTRGVFDNEQMRFGEVAVELGFMTADQVHRALADQVRWKIVRAFQREEPEWTFTHSESDLDGVGRFVLPIESLVLDAARWFGDDQKKDLVLGPVIGRFPSVRGEPTLLAERFEMTSDELRFVESLDGTRSILEVLATPAAPGPKPVDIPALLTALVLVGAIDLPTVKKDARVAAITRTSIRALDALSTPSRGPHPHPSAPPPPSASSARARATKAVLRLKGAREEARMRNDQRAASAPGTKPAVSPPHQPGNDHEARLLAEQAFQKGKAHLRANHLALAAPEFRRAVELDPKSIEYGLYERWSDLRLQPEGLAPAERDVLRGLARQAIQVDPNLAFAYYVLGHVAMTDGEDVAARRCFQQALRIDPQAIDAERHIRLLARRVQSPVSKRRLNRPVTPPPSAPPPASVPPPIVAPPAIVAPPPAIVVAPPAIVAPPPAIVVAPPAIVAPPVEAVLPPPALEPAPAPSVVTAVAMEVVGKGGSSRATLWVGLAGLVLVAFFATAAVAWKGMQPAASPRPPLPASPVSLLAIPTTAPSPTPPPPLPTPPPPSPAPTVAASSASSAPEAPRPSATTGRVLLPSAATGHRIFIDDRVAGEGAGDLVVPCGVHKIRIGSAGKTQPIEVPCGGDLSLKQ